MSSLKFHIMRAHKHHGMKYLMLKAHQKINIPDHHC
jgi:hypothetical protein